MRFTENCVHPTLSEWHVLVRVQACALNPIDYKKPGIPILGWGLSGKPVAQDFSGTVLESASTKFQVGDHVFGRASGCLAEVISAPETTVAAKPVECSFAEAAALPTAGGSSLQAVDATGVKLGDSVIVAGASGGCGSLALQLARHRVGPSGRIAAICGSSNRDFVQELDPASAIVDYRSPGSIIAEGGELRS